MSWADFVPRLRVSRVLAYGALWAIFVTASELLVAIPVPEGLGFGAQVIVIAPYFGGWLIVGWVAAAVALYGERWLDRGWKLVLSIAAVSIFGGAKACAAWSLLSQLPTSWAPEGASWPSGASWDLFFHGVWGTAFHGGLFIVACVFAMRGERQGQALADARLARSHAEAALDEARLDRLRGHVDPAFLLATMAAVQSRYENDADSADDLLDQLVGFLRGAMPGVRGTGSTLRAELAIARSYSAIRAAVDGPAAGVAIFSTEGPDIPFPSLLLLPLIDCFATGQQACGERSTLRVHHVLRTHTDIELTGPCGNALPQDMAFRLHVGLRAIFGDAQSVCADPGSTGTPASLRIRILQVAAEGIAREATTSSFQPFPLFQPTGAHP